MEFVISGEKYLGGKNRPVKISFVGAAGDVAAFGDLCGGCPKWSRRTSLILGMDNLSLSIFTS